MMSSFSILQPRNGVHMLGIDQQDLITAFQQIENGTPIHASPNVTKNVINWEYTVEILHSDLRTRLRDQPQASPPRFVLSHEGSCLKAPGALHVQSIPSEEAASGGQSHV